MTDDTNKNEEQQEAQQTEETPETEDTSTATAVAEEEHVPEPVDDHFERVDIDQFSHDDSAAGTAIGKMLALFFLYTVIVMSLSALWTFAVSD